jgi:phospholipid/cholesterol/gamma-HCH transport system substrate-binding protein
MVDSSKKVMVGLFVLISILIFSIGIILVGSGKGFMTRSHTIFVKYNHIKGLQIGATVHLAGINAGFVKDISFNPTQDQFEVLVTLDVMSRYFPLIRKDSEASITTRGLLGDKYIQISLGRIDSPPIKPGEFVNAKVETSVMDQLQGGGIVERVDVMLVSLSEIMDEISRGNRISKTLVYLEQAAHDIRTLSDKLNSESSALGQLISPNSSSMPNMALKHLNAATENMSNVMQKIDEGHGTIGALVNDPTLYEDIKVLVGGAKRNALLKFVVRESLKKSEDHL